MVKILACDIGLKNLAFCVASKQDDKYSIHLWENYNLLEDPVEKCNSLTKKEIVCGKNCKFISNGIHFCKMHLPKGFPFKEIKKKLVNSYTLQQLSLIVLKKILDIYNNNPAVFLDLDSILIEKQLRLNPKMIMVSNLIFGKFTELLEDKNTTIRFINASRKAILFGSSESEITGTLKGNKGYANRKKASIEYGTKFLHSGQVENADFWIQKLGNMNVIDDAHDAFLYCISELMDKKEFKVLKDVKKTKKLKNKKK